MEYDSHFFKFKLYIFFLLIFLNNFKEIKTANCNENTNMGNNECYTDILKFDNNRWRAGHSALNKNGDFIIEFSPDAEDTALMQKIQLDYSMVLSQMEDIIFQMIHLQKRLTYPRIIIMVKMYIQDMNQLMLLLH